MKQDLRYAVRMLLRSPTFAAMVIATLALGIGANTAMYSIVHAVMLRPLALHEPDQLVRVYESNPSLNRPTFSASVPNYLSWKEQARSLDLTALQGYAANWTEDLEPERLEGIAATSSFLATMLIIGAGLLLQSFARLQSASLGLEPDSVLTARVSLPRARYADGTAISAFFSRLTDSLQSVPGVQGAGVSSAIPMGPGSTTGGTVAAVDPPDSSLGQPMSSAWRSVDAGFFAALRIPLLRGRVFGPEDIPDRCCVFMLSQQAARSLFGTSDPVDQQLRLNGTVGEVIGVVGDIRMKGIADPPESVVYLPISQGGRFGVFAMFVKTRDGSPEAAATLIKERLREIDSAVPAFGFRAMDDWIDSSSARTRIRTWVLTVLAAVALGLGIIGIYGLLAYLVALRRHEFGVRLALGAQPGSLLRLVLAQGLGLATIGIGIGLVGAVMLTGILETLLFGVSTRDPMTFLGVAILLLVAALIASYAPARRAAHADPIAALRAE